MINSNNMSKQIFQNLKNLPIPLHQTQCVLHKHELLICGGFFERACYSYHTLKNEYKFICEYPSDVRLYGHSVVKLVNNNKDSNETTLLSFGGNEFVKRHTFMMKYISVWSNMSNKSNELNNYNQWVPFTDNHNHPVIIGRDQNHSYIGVRAVIGGSNNHLLFVTCYNNISVFDLNTFQCIKQDKLLAYSFSCHCFVSISENGQGQEMIKTDQEKNKQNYQMLLFSFRGGLSIEYDEDNNTFQFHQLSVCNDIALLNSYGYVRINDVIFFFGGWDYRNASKSVYKYSIRENKWMTFQNTLPSPLKNCVAILSEEDNHIHIIGGQNHDTMIVSTHMKTNARTWDHSLLVMISYLFL
ncbi:hypothetical protein RFI_21906 [Reticulomyxa filosa]|uniref:Kelch motif family protein n=1 Tax=Reticulomyxa filosa TaxID=46433 RepID=X6MN96_RETFI|nr:hypothetical protein RFI_21906 [Reticulomyxa filosa]|eukprot:ETO15458.1 hypothetical protein RFI_21906 [Reticulomyxa filosa]